MAHRYLSTLAHFLLVALPLACVALLFWGDLEPYNSTQLWITRGWVILLLVYLMSRVFLQQDATTKIKEFLFEPLSPVNLAMLRIAHFSVFVYLIVVLHLNFGEYMTRGFAHFPETSKIPIPYGGFFNSLPVSPEVVHYTAIAFNIVLIMSFLGLWTPVSTKIYLLLALYLFGIPKMFGKITHTHYMVWFPAILAFSDCGRVFSLDALIRKYIFKKTENVQPSARYGIPIKFAMITLGIIYFFPGFWKLWGNGFDWIFQLNLRNLMHSQWGDLHYWTPAFRIDQYPVLIVLASIFTVVVEFGFIFFMLRKQYRVPLALAGIAMHTGIYCFMKIPFFLLCLNYAALFDWGKIFDRKNLPQLLPENIPQVLSRMKVLVVVFSLMTMVNLLFGFGKIFSWPFTCFPTFDYRVPTEMSFIYYEGLQGDSVVLPHDSVTARIEKRIPYYYLRELTNKVVLEASLQNDSLDAHVHKIFPFHEDYPNVDSIQLWMVRKPIRPDARDDLRDKRLIYTVHLGENKSSAAIE